MRNSELNPVLNQYFIKSKYVKNTYIPNLSLFNDGIKRSDNIALPFNIDTEYSDALERQDCLSELALNGKSIITVQLKGINESEGTILVHPDFAETSKNQNFRHDVINSDCVLEDWLKSKGINITIRHDPFKYEQARRTCRLIMYAHFALADISGLAGSQAFLLTIQDLFKNKRLKMARRLVAGSSYGQIARLSNWVMTLENVDYKLSLSVIDTIAIHGNVSYKALAQNVGVKLDDKDSMGSDISRMDKAYFDNPSYDAYALGDLRISEILYKNAEFWQKIRDGFNVNTDIPKLTIGASVATLFKDILLKEFPTDDMDYFHTHTTKTHNTSTLAAMAIDKNPLSLLAKIDGGRCINTMPLLIKKLGALCDTDIDGAYATGMSACPFIVGKARYFSNGTYKDYKDNSNLNQCIKLVDWLKIYEKKLVKRAWVLKFSTLETLNFSLDLFPSWFDWRVLAKRLSDTEKMEYEVSNDVHSGKSSYLRNEIYNATLTHDLLDVLRGVLSRYELMEFMNKCVVRAAVYFDKKDFISWDTYKEKFANGTLNDEWTFKTIGELISDSARGKRIEAQKLYGKKSPMDTLLKLVSNTSYGISVSPFFSTSSVVTASNVTASVRAYMFLAEKSLNMVGCVTDGQVFDLNKVLHNTDSVKISSYAINPYRFNDDSKMSSKRLRYGSLVGDYIELIDSDTIRVHDGNKSTIIKNASNWIDGKIREHVNKTFSHCEITKENFLSVKGYDDNGVIYEQKQGVFDFKSYPFLQKIIVHSSANYQHIKMNGDIDDIKMRSYEKRQHQAFTMENDGLKLIDTYKDKTPAMVFFECLNANKNAVPLLPPFLKTRILKPGVYTPKNGHNSKYHNSLLLPGDSIYAMGQPRYLSLSQLPFKTRLQLETWKRIHDSLIAKHGLSLEAYFIHDGFLDYEKMLFKLIDMVMCEVINPVKLLGHYPECEHAKTYHEAKKTMSKMMDRKLIFDNEDDFYINAEDYIDIM